MEEDTEKTTMTLKNFRENLLYIGSKPRKKKDGYIGQEYDSYRTASILKVEAKSLKSADRSYGDKNGNQITMLTIKYLISIYLFSLKWNRDLFKDELEELEDLISKFFPLDDEMDKDVYEYKLTSDLHNFLKLSQPELLKLISKKDFYDLEISSPVLLYLLYFLVSYGSSDKLIKDFSIIAEESEKLQYKKSKFIFQKNYELYNDDMLLAMLLEPLAKNHHPVSLVEKYNFYLEYYVNLLKKDDAFLPSSHNSYTRKHSKRNPELKLEDRIILFPEEKDYSKITFPNKIMNLNSKNKEKTLTVIFDLFNLRISRHDLHTDIRARFKEDQAQLSLLLEKLKGLKPNTHTIKYEYSDFKDFRVLQEASSLSPKLHFVFNKQIIKLLQSLSSYLPNGTHPFIYVKRKDI
ncbi:hypothetical protein [Fundicoccus culcitae]|uniref:Uncharacterized protein n=1 Tax=Fundicoccus culcitae TaxID=2969821 RepID=A0ABY5P4D2_9LACT|nr:hypothetical protein [Fundicoccus culcitae]UUX33268.1 hypothetical protein NRE15_10175 [Fundicoccus culcitae]